MGNERFTVTNKYQIQQVIMCLTQSHVSVVQDLPYKHQTQHKMLIYNESEEGRHIVLFYSLYLILLYPLVQTPIDFIVETFQNVLTTKESLFRRTFVCPGRMKSARSENFHRSLYPPLPKSRVAITVLQYN